MIILEDAEHFLMKRGSDNATEVADLLNAGDGLLGDFLQLHLICTLNCEFSRMDSAVTRPGQLVAYREFPRLTAAQAKKLAAAKNLSLVEQASYSLAEIYHGSCQPEWPITEPQMGFKG